jgi:hypothetical protein
MPSSLLRSAGLVALLLAAAACDDDDSPTRGDSAALVPEPASGGLVSFFGRIDGLRSDGLTVAGRDFGIDGDTRVFVQQNEAPLSILRVGEQVVVRARQNRAGAWMAREIKVRVDAPSEVKVTGRVDAIRPPELTVAGRPVITGPDTAYLGAGEPRSLADVRSGDLVTVTGFEVDRGVLQALKIRVESRS